MSFRHLPGPAENLSLPPQCSFPAPLVGGPGSEPTATLTVQGVRRELRDDHDGETVDSLQVHGDGAEDAVIFVGAAAHNDGDARLGPVLAAEFVSDRGELVGHRAVPTLKVLVRDGP